MLLALKSISIALFLHNAVIISTSPQQIGGKRVMLIEQTGLGPTNTFKLVKLPVSKKGTIMQQQNQMMNPVLMQDQVGQQKEFIPQIPIPLRRRLSWRRRPITVAGKVPPKRTIGQVAKYIVNRYRKQQNHRRIGSRRRVILYDVFLYIHEHVFTGKQHCKTVYQT
jgi:hypothetical protein